MDPRVERHAELLVNHSAGIEPGEMVYVVIPAAGEELAIALAEQIGKQGGIPFIRLTSSRADAAYKEAVDPEDLAEPGHELALAQETDVVITVRASNNLSESSGIDEKVVQTRTREWQEIREEFDYHTRGVITQYPTPGDAQRAEMSTSAYQDFVYSAIDKDWQAQEAFQEQLIEILDAGSEVRIVSGDETDITMSIDGNPAVNDNAEVNLPGGEGFTAPIPDSVEGTIRFDQPRVMKGKEVRGIYLEFEGGEVVDYDARSNVDTFSGFLQVDDGVRRVGELGFGMNRDIDKFTANPLFDEKMGDTIHLALGSTIPETVGESNEGNESAIHVDFITDMSEDSYVEVDGEVVQRNGTFVFEDGFDEASGRRAAAPQDRREE